MRASYIQREVQAHLILAHCLLFLVLPVASFILAICTFRSRVSQCFFIAYAFYFGSYVGACMDLEQHYHTLLTFANQPVNIAWTAVDWIGKEPWHKLFKLSIVYISTSREFFSGCAAAVYATFFLFFINQYRRFYLQPMGKMQMLVLLTMALTVEFYWYYGLRYWNGGFFFCAFYSKFILSEKKKYLVLSSFSLLFHFGLLNIVAAAFINYLLGHRMRIKAALAVCGIFLRGFSNQIINWMAGLPIISAYTRGDYSENENLAEGARTLMVRNGEANLVYQSRWDILFGVACILLYTLWRKNRNLFKNNYPQFSGFLLILFFITNLSYVEIVLYQRTYKLLILMTYSYLFILLRINENKWLNRSSICVALFAPVVLYALATQVVEQRDTLMDWGLWFSNIYTRLIHG